jgi:Ubiquitin 3 binding protein But2 C-terminal domain
MQSLFQIFAVFLIAFLPSFVRAVPLKQTERSVGGPIILTLGAEFYRVISQAEPDTDFLTTYGSQTAIISRSQGSDEVATLVSFQMPAISDISGATASSTCDFVVKNPGTASGSQILQLFTLGYQFSESISPPVTFNSHPYYNQYEGEYYVSVGGDSTAIDVFTFPCVFGTNMQFVLRPQNDNDYISWEQDSISLLNGAYIEVRN